MTNVPTVRLVFSVGGRGTQLKTVHFSNWRQSHAKSPHSTLQTIMRPRQRGHRSVCLPPQRPTTKNDVPAWPQNRLKGPVQSSVRARPVWWHKPSLRLSLHYSRVNFVPKCRRMSLEILGKIVHTCCDTGSESWNFIFIYGCPAYSTVLVLVFEIANVFVSTCSIHLKKFEVLNNI